MLLTFCTFSGPIKGPNNLRLWLSFRAEKRRQAAASGGGQAGGTRVVGRKRMVAVALWLWCCGCCWKPDQKLMIMCADIQQAHSRKSNYPFCQLTTCRCVCVGVRVGGRWEMCCFKVLSLRPPHDGQMLSLRGEEGAIEAGLSGVTGLVAVLVVLNTPPFSFISLFLPFSPLFILFFASFLLLLNSFKSIRIKVRRDFLSL